MAPHCSVLVYLTSLVAFLQATSDFIEPVEELLGVEYYEFEGDRFGIFMQKVTWEEANQLCPTRNGSLVTFDISGVPEFIARALAESAVGFGSLWIGGHLKKASASTNATWYWNTNTTIDSKLNGVTKFPMDAPPYWVDKPMEESSTPMCLGTDRKLHHLPLIVAVECDQKRPYICKLPGGGKSGTPTPVPPPIVIGDKTYHLFHGAFTWQEALGQCLILGMKLAKLVSADHFRIIGNRMRRTRPIMENAWIGGQFTNGAWQWVSTSEPINVNKTQATDKLPFAWYRENEIIMDGCLLADRHVCDHFVYVEAQCDRRRPYICEKESEKGLGPPLINIPNSTLWISTYTETWFKAQNACKICLGGELIHIKSTGPEVLTQLPTLFQGMAITVGIEIRHVWIGGYLFDNDFKWTDSDGKEFAGATALTQKTFDALHGDGAKGILEYCSIDVTVDTFLLIYKCLNMDRENQKNFFMYGLQCDMKQHFICQAPEGTKLKDECVPKGVINGVSPPDTATKNRQVNAPPPAAQAPAPQPPAEPSTEAPTPSVDQPPAP